MLGAKRTNRSREVDADLGPLRLCAVSRARLSADDLVRFVLGPDGVIVPDLARRLPGRGVWVTATKGHVVAAVRRRVFARSLKQQVSVPDDLADRLEQLMVKRLTEAVSLANKAGLLVSGFAKVEALIDAARAWVLLHASEAALDGVRKLDHKFNALHGGEDGGERVIRELDSAELSLAIGRPNVIHAAASEGGAARRIVFEAARLRRYRMKSAEGSCFPTVGSNTGRA